MIRFYTLLFLTLLSISSGAQDKRDPAELHASSITAEELREHLMILASDEYEGRETGQEGQKKAARYIAKHYETLGYKPIGENGTYYQTIPLIREAWGEVNATVGDEKFEFLKDFYSFARNTKSQKLEVDEVTFLGYGINDEKYSDYKGINVKDKVCMIYGGEPSRKGVNVISGTSAYSDWTTNWRKKLETANQEGVKTLLIVMDDIKGNIDTYGSYINGGSMKLDSESDSGKTRKSRYAQAIYISTDMAKAIAGKSWRKVAKAKKKMDKKGRAGSMEISSPLTINGGKRKERNDAENIFAYVEGSDLKDELIVMTAHYDHLGKSGDKVYNGAGPKRLATDRGEAFLFSIMPEKKRGFSDQNITRIIRSSHWKIPSHVLT